MMHDERGPATRALLDAARGGTGPDAAAIRRMRAGVAAAVGASTGIATAVEAARLGDGGTSIASNGASTGASNSTSNGTSTGASNGTSNGASTATSTGASSSLASSAVSFKLGGLAVVAALALGLVSGARPAEAPTAHVPQLRDPTHAIIDHLPVAATSRVEAVIAPAPEVTPDRTAQPPVATHAPDPTAPDPTRKVTAIPREPRVPAASHSDAVELSREVELIDRAMDALRRGDAAAARDAVLLHRTETRGKGQLDEDAAAIEIEAMCLQRDPAVAIRFDAFDERYPRSAQRARLSAACR